MSERDFDNWYLQRLLYPGKYPLWRPGEGVTLAQNHMGLLKPDAEHAGLTVGYGNHEVPIRDLYKSRLFRMNEKIAA